MEYNYRDLHAKISKNKLDNPSSGIKIRDRYHSPFREVIEEKYSSFDWKMYGILIDGYFPCDRKNAIKQANEWKKEVLNLWRIKGRKLYL